MMANQFRARFMGCLAESSELSEVRIDLYYLLANHVHLVLEIVLEECGVGIQARP